MLGVLALLALSAAGAPQVAVLDLSAEHGASADLTRAISDAAVVAVRAALGAKEVVGAADIRTLVAFQDQRNKLGCQDTGCLVELGGALGVREVVTGTLTRLGGVYFLALRRIDVRSTRVLRESSRSVADEAGLVAALGAEVAELYPADAATAGPPSGGALALAPPASPSAGAVLAGTANPAGRTFEPAPPEAVTAPPPELSTEARLEAPGGRSHALGIVLLAGAAVAAAATVVGLVDLGSFYGAEAGSSTVPLPVDQAQAAANRGNLGAGLAFGGALAFLACVATAGLTW